MANYIDGFALPIHKSHLDIYKSISQKIAEIWKEYGALSYYEFVGDDLHLEGTRSFIDAVNAQEHEVIIFGWVTFASKQARDEANRLVPADPRMSKLMLPLSNSENPIFDPNRMVYGGFNPLVALHQD